MFDKIKLGYKENEIANLEDMQEIYPLEKQENMVLLVLKLN